MAKRTGYNKDDVASVADSVLKAGLDPSQWMDALKRIADLTASNHAQILCIDGPAKLAMNFISGYSPEERDSLLHDPRMYDETNWRIQVSRGLHDVVHEADYLHSRDGQPETYYTDICRRTGIINGCQTIILDDPQAQFGFALLRSERDGETTPEDRAVFELLSHHMTTAVRTHLALADEATKLLCGAMDSMRLCAFFCDRKGRVLSWTQAAEGLISNGIFGINGADGVLVIRNSADGEQLRGRFKSVFTGSSLAPSKFRLRPRAEGRGQFQSRLCEVIPLPVQEHETAFRPSLMVVVSPPNELCFGTAEKESLRMAFGLSEAEAEITLALAMGISREEIALRRNVSHGTVNVQIKSVFAKTGASREGELVALVHTCLR